LQPMAGDVPTHAAVHHEPPDRGVDAVDPRRDPGRNRPELARGRVAGTSGELGRAPDRRTEHPGHLARTLAAGTGRGGSGRGARAQLRRRRATGRRRPVQALREAMETAVSDDDTLLEIRGLKTHFFTRDGVVRAVDGV